MRIKNLVVRFMSVVLHFIPRNKHLWLTGKPSPWYKDFDPPKFFDNSKYFYLYLVNNTNEKVYWISSSESEMKLLQSMDLPVVKFGTIKALLLILRAKFFFHHYGINQIDDRLQYGAVHLDFWHGTPLKKIRYDVVPKVEVKRSKLIEFLDKNAIEYVSSTSEFLSKEILCKAFDLPFNQMLNFGYPRTDILKLNKTDTYDFAKKYSKELIPYFDKFKSFKKIFLYMPTWRDDDPDYFTKANIDFETLNSTFKNKNYLFLIKLHPLTKNVCINNFSNILQINNDVDVYPLLNYSDFLITDYSSIFFDYLLTDKEMMFIPYDYENYVKNRALYFDYDEITPGKKYYSFNDFIRDIDNVEKLNFAEDRNRVMHLLYDEYNFDACEKIYLNVKDC